MNHENALIDAAKQTAGLLSNTDHKVIFAESCTCGLLAAALSRVPGISQHLCGSFVTYRESLKVDALDVSQQTLSEHTAVSSQTSLEMLSGALGRCSEATVGLAITGHLGPNAPDELDGRIFIACGLKESPGVALPFQSKLSAASRHERQMEAAVTALEQLNSLIQSTVE